MTYIRKNKQENACSQSHDVTSHCQLTLEILTFYLEKLQRNILRKITVLIAWRERKDNKYKKNKQDKSRKENPEKLTQLSSRTHPRHLVGKRTAQKDTIIDITRDSQVNSNFPYRWSPASLTFNNYFYLFLYLYIT